MPDEVRLRALMVSYQAGSLEAFDQLYALVAPAIRGFLRRRLQHADAVRDLEQETFLQLHRARHTFDASYPALPWVMAIARHVWLMHERTRRRRPQATVDVESLDPGVRADADAFADRADVRAALATLPAERRRPVVWHHVIGLSFREIAARLGIREDAAKLRSSRAMGELRRQFGVKPRGRKTAGHE
jgi:RNA polymerase sigma-70 factor (ECF subfamily)